MDELTPRVLNHLSLFSFTDAYWLLNENARESFHQQWLQALAAAATNVDVYQSTDARADILVWCALNAAQPSSTADFFGRFATMTMPFRRLFRPVDWIWGFTRPLPDAKARSPQEIDPLSATRLQYLLAYPFGSGPEWYGMSRESRQAAVSERTRMGDEEAVKQLVLDSAGLQQHEYVMLYETDELERFAALASKLRDAEGSRFTRPDKPAYVAVYRPAVETLRLWK